LLSIVTVTDAFGANPYDGMSADDIAIQADIARMDSPPEISVGICVDAVDEITTIDFMKFEFAKLIGRAGHESLTSIDSQPLPGSTDAIVELWGPWATAEFRSVDGAGEMIEAIALRAADDDFARMYWAGTVNVPNIPFRVVVSGTDDNGTSFELTCPYLFQPQTVAVEFDIDFQHAPPGLLELNAQVTNYGPLDTFELNFSNDMDLPIQGSSAQVELAQGESANVVLTLDIPTISTGVLNIKTKLGVKGTVNPDAENHGTTLVRLERFDYIHGDGFDAYDSEETP